MNKIISIDKLQVGMEVVALDKSWLETNILFHRFRVQSKEEIQKLRDNGIRMVTVKLPDPHPSVAPAQVSGERQEQTEMPIYREMEVLPLPSLKEWNALHDKTVAVVSKSFGDVRMGNALEVAPLRQQVVETLELLLRDPRKNSFLVTLSEVDDESYVHSTNTMILAMGLADQSGVPREELPKWGLAALLHDIGKALIPLDILKKPGKLDPNEWETMKRHPKLGHSILSMSKDEVVRGLCTHVAMEHHERKGGGGYPFGLDLPDIDPVSRSLMVLDIYEALTAGRIYRPPLSPAKTLSYLLERELTKLDPRAIAHLVQMVGIYPVGSLVLLTDGRIALITSYKDPDTHTGPVSLLAIFSKPGVPLPEPVPLTLSTIDRSRVKQTFHPRELGLSPADIARYLGMAGEDPSGH
jgi:HD-GYP domain-containing protein (c-di-GMP phosphodiesterase class II)